MQHATAMPSSSPPPSSRPTTAAAPVSEQSITSDTIAPDGHAAGAREIAALVERIAVLSAALSRAVEVSDEHAISVLHDQIARIERFLRSIGQ